MWSILIPLAILAIVILIQIRRVKEAFADATSTEPTFNTPKAITIDSKGYLYVADTDNNTIRKITPTGDVLTLAGSATGYGYNDSPKDATDGKGTNFNAPTSIVINDEGTLYVADSGNNCIRKILPNGVTSTIAGLGGPLGKGNEVGSTNSAIRFDKPTSVCIDKTTKTTLYVVDSGNKKIRLLYLQQGDAGYGATKVADTFSFSAPYAIVQDPDKGHLYVSDTDKIYVLKSNSAGSEYTVSTLSDGAGTALSFINPTGMFFDWDRTKNTKTLYVCQSTKNNIVSVSLTPSTTDANVLTGAKLFFAGEGTPGTAKLDTTTNKIDGDGPVATCKLNQPYGIVKSTRTSDKGVFEATTFYVADSGSHTIRKIYPTDSANQNTSLTLLTVYGTGTAGYKDRQTTATIPGTITPTTTTPSSTTTPSTTPSSTTTPSSPGNITLTLADLMALYGFSSANRTNTTPGSTTTPTDTTTSTTTTTDTTVTGGATGTTAQTAKDFYNQIKPSLLEDIRTTISKQLSGSPYASLGPMGSGYDGSSAACAQGNELNSSVKNVIDSNDYIRKDSIPCYGCSL